MDGGPWAYPDAESPRVRLLHDQISLVAEDGTAFSIPLENVRSVSVQYAATPKEAKKAHSKHEATDPLVHGETTLEVVYRTTDRLTRRDRRNLVLEGAHASLMELAAEATRRAHFCKQ